MTRSGIVGRLLRVAAGVDEGILAEAAPERHRYTALGGVVVGTAAMAMCSMGLALATVTRGVTVAAVLAAIGWGLFVFTLDRWLVTSSHGLLGRRALLPRAALAVLFGLVIAEPVVLWVFDAAIEERIDADRRAAAREEEDLLTRCNPTDPGLRAAALEDPSCAGFLRNVPPPSGDGQLGELGGRRDRLQTEIDGLDARLATARDRYQRELSGEQGGDTTGRRGLGPVAQGLQAEIADLEGQRAPLQAQVAALDDDLAALLSASAAEQDTFAAQVGSEIDGATVTADQPASEAGLLERLGALGDLTREDRHVFVARWFLVAFLVAVDSLPVLVKLLSGRTTYDHLLHESLQAARGRWTRREEQRAGLDDHRTEQQHRVERRRADVAAERELLRLDAELETEHRSPLDLTRGTR